MEQYKLYKHVSGLSGAGIDSVSVRVTLESSVWDDVVKAAD